MSGGCGRKIRSPAKGFQPFQIASDFVFTIEIVVIICAQIPKGDAKFQHMVNSNEHGMSNCNCGTVFTPSRRDTLVLSRKVRTSHISGRLCTLDQNGFQGLIAFCCLSVLAFPCALMISGTQAGPGGNVCSTGKAAHICAKFRKDDFSAAPPNAGQFINCCYGGLVFCHVVHDHSLRH